MFLFYNEMFHICFFNIIKGVKSMSKKTSAPTMKDVAIAAGVALGTVSKVVNGLPVGKSYQKRVEAAIEKLDYRVNSYAKGLKSNKTYTIAFLVPDTSNPFFGRLTHYINRTLSKRGYKMLLCSTDSNPIMEQSLLDMAEQNRVDGIISISYSDDLKVKEGTRLVTIDRHITSSAPCVASDNFSGGQIAVNKLSELGCKKLLHMSIGSPLPTETKKRRDGFLSTCVSLGLEYDMLCLTDGEPYSKFTEYLNSHIIDGKFEYDGIFCGTDHLARFIITQLQSLGIKVPDDVQVIGFDGIRDYVTNKYLCSTIVQPLEQIAEVSVDLVLASDNSKIPSLICLPVTYEKGGTTRE